MCAKASASTLTNYERAALSSVFNLADGHAQHELPFVLDDAREDVLRLLRGGVLTDYDKLERSTITEYFELANQTLEQSHVRLFQSASQAIDAASQVVKALGATPYVVEPTFDNIPDIFCRNLLGKGYLPSGTLGSADTHCYSRTPLRSYLDQEIYPEPDLLFSRIRAPASLCLVLPNNPTGMVMSEANFRTLCEKCAAGNTVLICDFCFRFYSPTMGTWDQYRIARECGTSYLFIEDTGKAFPLNDLKLSFLACSPDLSPICKRIHNDFLLAIAPVILHVMRAIFSKAKVVGMKRILAPIQTNRAKLRAVLNDFGLTVASADSTLPVEWLCGIERGRSAPNFLDLARRAKVGILPGQPFYWNNPDAGSEFVRIALARPSEYFSEAITALQRAL